jgi:hypothetical protein
MKHKQPGRKPNFMRLAGIMRGLPSDLSQRKGYSRSSGSLNETDYLLHNPVNARRLLAATRQLHSGKSQVRPPADDKASEATMEDRNRAGYFDSK